MKPLNCILVVDDDYPTCHMYKFLIEKEKIARHVQIALNGEEALDYLLKRGKFSGDSREYKRPELLFLDINMPAMNGFEFLEAYRQIDPSFKTDVVIVMLTTSLNPDDKAKAESIEEVSEFRNKPLTKQMLKEIVDSYFAKS